MGKKGKKRKDAPGHREYSVTEIPSMSTAELDETLMHCRQDLSEVVEDLKRLNAMTCGEAADELKTACAKRQKLDHLYSGVQTELSRRRGAARKQAAEEEDLVKLTMGNAAALQASLLGGGFGDGNSQQIQEFYLAAAANGATSIQQQLAAQQYVATQAALVNQGAVLGQNVATVVGVTPGTSLPLAGASTGMVVGMTPSGTGLAHAGMVVGVAASSTLPVGSAAGTSFGVTPALPQMSIGQTVPGALGGVAAGTLFSIGQTAPSASVVGITPATATAYGMAGAALPMTAASGTVLGVASASTVPVRASGMLVGMTPGTTAGITHGTALPMTAQSGMVLGSTTGTVQPGAMQAARGVVIGAYGASTKPTSASAYGSVVGVVSAKVVSATPAGVSTQAGVFAGTGPVAVAAPPVAPMSGKVCGLYIPES